MPSLAECTAILQYARTLHTPTPPTYTGNLSVDLSVNAHGVPIDVAHQLLRIHDDLPWRVRSWQGIGRARAGTTRYTLELPGLCFYTPSDGEEPYSGHPIPTGEPDDA